MRNLLPKLLVLAATTLPIAAHADTLLDFTLTGPEGVVTFTLPEHPFFRNTIHQVIVGTSTSASLNGVSGYTIDLSFYTGIADPGDSLFVDVFSLDPSLTGSFDVNLYGLPLVSPYFGADYPPPPGDFAGLLPTGQFGLADYNNGHPPISFTPSPLLPRPPRHPNPQPSSCSAQEPSDF